MLLNPFWEKLYQNPVQFFSVIPRGALLPHSNALQYYVECEKSKVNDVIFPSGCEARAINLSNKNMKIGIFTGGTSVRSKNIFTDISRYSIGKHEINCFSLAPLQTYVCVFSTNLYDEWKKPKMYKSKCLLTSDNIKHFTISQTTNF